MLEITHLTSIDEMDMEDANAYLKKDIDKAFDMGLRSAMEEVMKRSP